MKINNLTQKDHRHVKYLLSSLDFLTIRDFLIDRNVYTVHNRSALLLHILLMGDYDSAICLIDDKLSEVDYITIAKFGDENVFNAAMFALSEEQRPKLALTLINNSDKTFDVFEKCESIIKIKAIDDAVLKSICINERGEILKYFLCYLDFGKNQEDYASLMKDLVKIIIKSDNFINLQMLLKYYTCLSDEEILLLGQDQFSWYANRKYINDSLIEAIYKKIDVFRFKIVTKSRKLTNKQIEDLFDPEYFPLFCTYVVENLLPANFEKKLYVSDEKYLSEYLKYHQIGIWKYIKYNIFR